MGLFISTELSFVYKNIWHSALPLKISCLMLRLLRDRLPLASSIRRFAVQGPSKFFFMCTQMKNFWITIFRMVNLLGFYMLVLGFGLDYLVGGF